MRIANAALCVLSLVLVGAIFGRATAADPAAAKGTITGQVTYGDPIANITVTLDGAVKKTTKTDEKGQFVFEDLPPGDYKLEAEGVAKNNHRKGSAAVTLPEPPKKLSAITIKLK